MKTKFVLFFILISMMLFCQDMTNDATNDLLVKLFSKEQISSLKNGDIISRMFVKYDALGENTHLSIDIPKTDYTNEDFSVYEILTDEKVFIPYVLNDGSKLDFYNLLASFSKLNGMNYYSRSSSKVEKLILNCFKIESPKNKKNINDTTYDKIEPKITNYFLQQDNKFGKITFKSELMNDSNNFILINTCVEPISSIININNGGEYKIISFFVYDEKSEGFYYYSINAMRVRVNFLLKNGLLRPTTFSNRLRAATVHFAKLLGLDWSEKLNPWDETKLKNGEYKTY